VPVAFSRLTADCFETPQSALLLTGIALIAWRWLGSAVADLGRGGVGEWLRSGAGRVGLALERDPLGILILVYLLSATVSTLLAPLPERSLHGAHDSSAGLKVAFATAAVYFTARSVSGGQGIWLVRFARAAGFAGAVASAYALVQLAGLDPWTWGEEAFFGKDLRVFGTLGHPNLLGAYLMMTFPLTAWLALRAKHGAERIAWALVSAVFLVVIAATLSRGAWIGLLAGVTVGLLLELRSPARGLSAARGGRRSGRAVTGAAAAAILVLAAAALLFSRHPVGKDLATRIRQIASLEAPTTQSRLHIWRAGLRMFHDHPWLGVGLDSFGTAFPRYRTSAYWRVEWGRTPNQAHNEPIQILATQGLFGGAAALLIVLLAAASVWGASDKGDPAARGAAAAAGGALAGFAAQDLAGFTVAALGTLAAALAGWASAAASPGPDRRETEARLRRGGTPAWALAVAGIPVAALVVLLVGLPVRAQVLERLALEAPLGSPTRAEFLQRAEGAAPWDPRYANLLALSLDAQAPRESSAASTRDVLARAHVSAERAIAMEPENGYYHLSLGRIEASQTHLRPPGARDASVREVLASAVARDTVNGQILDQAASSLLEIGQTKDARVYALRSATLYPGLARPMAFLGWLAVDDRRFRDAVDTLRIALGGEWRGDRAGKAAAWGHLAASYLELGRNAEARDAAARALELNPGDPDARSNRDLAISRLSEEKTR